MSKKTAELMIHHALQAVEPFTLIQKQVHLKNNILTIAGKEFHLQDFKNIYVIGFGKAAAPMAAALEDILAELLTSGVIIVKYGHVQELSRVRILEAAHPVPDENCISGARQIVSLAEQAGPSDLVIVLISGGGSALFEQLPAGITLQDFAKFSEILLACGAKIDEINTLRKHISLVKGGQLARIISPAMTVSLILSDVIGDPLNTIASGPTAPDTGTFDDAVQILEKYQIKNIIPPAIYDWLQKGLDGTIPETPSDNDKIFDTVFNIIIGNNSMALNILEEKARYAGYRTFILSDRIEGEARQVAKVLAATIQSSLAEKNSLKPPACLIAGGEPTVTIKGSGLGGRNQELVLAVLLEMGPTNKKFHFCSIGTDGTDGPTDAAGAWIDQNSYSKALELNLDMQSFLDNNDAYNFFERIDQLIKTGPTKTNVMDFIFCLF